MERIRDPRFRVWMAFVLLAVCLVGWPLSVLTWASGEPPTVLHLSWLALVVGAVNTLATTDVRRRQENDDG